MKLLFGLATNLVFFTTFLPVAATLSYLGSASFVQRNSRSAQVQHELGPYLSEGSSIFGPSEPSYHNSTLRWNVYAPPMVEVVVEPAQESDISTIVRYCNQNNIQFLLYSRGHGYSKSLGSFNGLQINMVNLAGIAIQPDGKSAWLQGGTFDGQVVDYLWDHGYVTPTGSCACVGMGGASLGGGHGRLEGSYGMISDNFRQLNIVLADGSPLSVNATSHSDLFWAMKGAGHNFGIVTSFEMSIYPRGPDTWHYKKYTWRSDKLVPVFTALNELHGNGSTPVNMAANFGNIFINTTITEDEPIIYWTFAYRGSAQDAAPYFASFDAIEAVFFESGDVPYPEIAHAQDVGLQDPSCGHDVVRITTSAGVQMYNITAEKRIMESFMDRIRNQPDVARAGFIIHEGYATKGVTDVSPSSSAYPFRDDHHLLYFQGNLVPGSGLEEDMFAWGVEVRDLWNLGQPGRLPDTYVNYANGYESVEEMYGHEPWRIEKLRNLKAKYDPQNRFRFYNPIIRS